MHKSGIFRIHPAFRVVALAEPPVMGNNCIEYKFIINHQIFLSNH